MEVIKSFFAISIILVFSSFLPPSAISSQNFQPIVANLDIGSTVENDCVLHLNFDESTGETIYDPSGENNHGTLVNLNENEEWVKGICGKALKLDGENDYILVQNSESLNPDYITLEAWVYLENLKNQAIIRKYPSYWFGVNDRGHIAFELNIDGTWRGSWNLAPVGLETEKWHHIAATYDGLHMRVYHNGVLVKTTSYIAGTIDPSTSDIGIGRNLQGASFFEGIIDEVRVYSRALPSAEIWQHYSKIAEGVLDLEPLISWSYRDPDCNQQVEFQIQVGSENGNSLWDYAENSADTWVKYNGLPLSTDVTYYVRVRAYDGHTWSDWASEIFQLVKQPRFELSNLSIEPKQVMPGGTVYVSVDVANVGAGQGSYPVVLTIGGVETETKVVTLNPGESERVDFIIVSEDKYTVDIEGMPGNFEVVPFSPAMHNFLIATFIAAILTMTTIFVKRKMKSK